MPTYTYTSSDPGINWTIENNTETTGSNIVTQVINSNQRVSPFEESIDVELSLRMFDFFPSMTREEYISKTIPPKVLNFIKDIRINSKNFGICSMCDAIKIVFKSKFSNDDNDEYENIRDNYFCVSCLCNQLSSILDAKTNLNFRTMSDEDRNNYCTPNIDALNVEGDLINYYNYRSMYNQLVYYTLSKIELNHDYGKCNDKYCKRPLMEHTDPVKKQYLIDLYKEILLSYQFESFTTIIGKDGEQYHSRCTRMCDNCKEYHSQYKCTNNVNSEVWCNDCFEAVKETLTACDACSGYNTEDHEMHWSDWLDMDVCDHCWLDGVDCNECGYTVYLSETNGNHYCEEDGYEDDQNIHNYSYKPTPVFLWDRYEPEPKYFLGIELEVELKNGNSSEATTTALEGFGESNIYLKSDGSLNNGFEIVTHPMSLLYYQNSMNWSTLDRLKELGIRSWNTGTCGLHVHISRTAFDNSYPFSDSHLIRFTKFIYDNQRMVERIAGRTSNHYSSFNEKGKIVKKIKENQNADRYVAVNTTNEFTVEVRVFKGSLRKERVLSAIEFCHAVVEYTRDLKIVPKKAPFSWSRFVTYVTNNEERYPNFFIILNDTFNKDTTPSDNNN
jgi:hypothetical protein